MTLVAGISIGGLPAFIGDLLLAWRLPSAIDLPTQKRVTKHPGTGQDHAAGLAQKLVIVRPYLLLAWAGEHADAIRIIRKLDRFLPESETELDDLHPMFATLDTCRPGTEMVALLLDEDSIRPFGVRTRGFELDGRRVYLLGSGAPDFFQYLQTHPELLPNQKNEGSLVAQAIMLRFAARAFALQWVIGQGFSNSWGGGFEVAFRGERGFKKVENLLCRAWMIDERGMYHNSGRSFFTRYYGKDLYLNCFNPDEKTFVVRSPLKGNVKVPKTELVHPEWTLDMFFMKTNGSFVEFARFHPPRRPVLDQLQLKKGRVVGWKIDQEYVAECAKTAMANVNAGAPNSG